MSIRVISKRAGGIKAMPGEMVINIARPSVLGNPFKMECESQRDGVVAQYKDWLEHQYRTNMQVRSELHRIADLVKAGTMVAVECWCAPCACHGDVIVEAVQAINNKPAPFKLIVAGGRDFNDYQRAKLEIMQLANTELSEYAVSIVSGMARGADALAVRFAREYGVKLHEFPADWERNGKRAGFDRNAQMAQFADGLLAFWDGKSRGTKHMIDTARALQLAVRVIHY